MKRHTARLKDRADAEALRERFGITDQGRSLDAGHEVSQRRGDEQARMAAGGIFRTRPMQSASVLEFGRRLRPRTFPPGVRKFKSVADLKSSSRA